MNSQSTDKSPSKVRKGLAIFSYVPRRALRIVTFFGFGVIIVVFLLLTFYWVLDDRPLSGYEIFLMMTCLFGLVFGVFLVLYGIHVKIIRDSTEQQLGENQERYRSVIAASNTGAWEFHSDTGVLWCSPEYFDMLGFESGEFASSHQMNLQEVWLDLLHPEDKQIASDNFQQYLADTSPGMYENYFRMRHKTGRWVWIWSRARTLFTNEGGKSHITLGTHIDITEKKNLEIELLGHKENLERLVEERTAQLIRTEKMASLGVLTAGVAHEINNPLNFIYGGLYGMKHSLNDSKMDVEYVQSCLDNIENGARRIKSIVDGLHEFTRMEEVVNDDINVVDMIDNCLLMLNHKLEKNQVIVSKEHAEEVSTIMGNSRNLHQLMANVLRNAIQSMEGGGTLSLSTSVNGTYCQIVVSDTGHGIKDEHLSNVTDPFFTTRDPGKGVGLGLSIAYTIVRDHDGQMTITSKEGKGTKVSISLPLKLDKLPLVSLSS